MGKSAFASLCLSASALVLLACGSTVTYEDDGGGGAGGAPQPSSGPGQTKGPTTATKTVATTGPAGPTTVQTVGPTTTNQQSSISVVSTGSGMCDSGDCESCQQCSFEGPCMFETQACSNNVDCIDFINCISECFDEPCYDQCQIQYPGGVDEYYALATCVICDACFFSCDGASAGC